MGDPAVGGWSGLVGAAARKKICLRKSVPSTHFAGSSVKRPSLPEGGPADTQAKQAAASTPAKRRRALRIIKILPRLHLGKASFAGLCTTKPSRSIMRVLFYLIQ